MRCVIFDLDGTLADTSADLIDAANSCFIEMGYGAQLDHGTDALTAFGGGRAMLRLGLSRAGAPWTEAEVGAWYPRLLTAYEAGIDRHTRLYPGAREAVESLRAAGFATGVCTNKPEGLARLLLARLGFLDAFAALVGADTLPVRKPDPAPLRAAIERAGGAVGRALLVGDTITDRDCARALGVPCALVTFGPQGDGIRTLSPDATVDALSEVPALAARLLR
jgi:phosphoglycolate phosphatase